MCLSFNTLVNVVHRYCYYNTVTMMLIMLNPYTANVENMVIF